MIFIKKYIKQTLVLIKRFSLFSLDTVLMIFFALFNLMKYKKLYDDDIVFVTAAEENYYIKVQSLLNSYFKNLNNKLVLYDLGLKPDQIINLKKSYSDLEIRKFQFDKFPKFIGTFHDDKLGSYAWKPIIVDHVLNEFKCKVVWLDAGNVINKKVVFLKIALTSKKFISPLSSNTIKDWTHPSTFKYISIKDKYLTSPNYASGLISFDYKNEKSKRLSNEWKLFSEIEDCIAPIGSSRDNHRQDQTILTLLIYKNLIKNKIQQLTYPRTNFSLGINFHGKKIYNF